MLHAQCFQQRTIDERLRYDAYYTLFYRETFHNQTVDSILHP